VSAGGAYVRYPPIADIWLRLKPEDEGERLAIERRLCYHPLITSFFWHLVTERLRAPAVEQESHVTQHNLSHSPTPEPIDDTKESTAGDLERYGIIEHQHTSYEWNGYRYSNSSDAITAAKRASR
jgi:hypothetical protein